MKSCFWTLGCVVSPSRECPECSSGCCPAPNKMHWHPSMTLYQLKKSNTYPHTPSSLADTGNGLKTQQYNILLLCTIYIKFKKYITSHQKHYRPLRQHQQLFFCCCCDTIYPSFNLPSSTGWSKHCLNGKYSSIKSISQNAPCQCSIII